VQREAAAPALAAGAAGVFPASRRRFQAIPPGWFGIVGEQQRAGCKFDEERA
jgi:hypothetical protein